jgi:hypothetical protein
MIMYRTLRKLSKSLMAPILSAALPLSALRCGSEKRRKNRRKSNAKEDRPDSSLVRFSGLFLNFSSRLNINRDLPLKTTSSVKVVVKVDNIREEETTTAAEVAREVVPTETNNKTQLVLKDLLLSRLLL